MIKTLNRYQLIAIIFIITLFSAFPLAQILQDTTLYSLNPWTQRFFTDFGESEQLFKQSVNIYSGELVLPYSSFLRTTTFLLTEGGALDSFALFQVGSILLRVVYVVLIMMIVIAMTHKVQYALVVGLLVYTSPYFVFRSHLFVPENVVVLFFLLMIWGFEKYRKTGRVLFLLVVMLSVLGNVFYDPTSVFISGIIIVSYTVVFLANGDLRKVEFTYFGILFAVIMLIPMFSSLISIAQANFNRFGDNSMWLLYSRGTDVLPELNVNIYFELIGYPVAIFSILGIATIVRHHLRHYVHLLMMLLFMLLFTINLSPQIRLSPLRMQDYLYIPLLLISAVYVSVLFRRTGRLVRMALVSILITFGIATMIENPPWLRVDRGAFEVANTANELLEANSDAIVYVEADAMFTTMLIRHPEQICAYWDPVFQWYRQPDADDVPDCLLADYRISSSEQALQQYQIIEQVDMYRLYARLPDA